MHRLLAGVVLALALVSCGGGEDLSDSGTGFDVPNYDGSFEWRQEWLDALNCEMEAPTIIADVETGIEWVVGSCDIIGRVGSYQIVAFYSADDKDAVYAAGGLQRLLEGRYAELHTDLQPGMTAIAEDDTWVVFE